MEEILDIEDALPAMNLANKGDRFINGLIDGILIQLVFTAIFISIFDWDYFVELSSSIALNSIYYLYYLVYYIFMEYCLGKSIGKMITKTHVVNLGGEKPSFGQCVGRSFIRMIPIEAFSFLGETGVGWHDKWVKTRVVKD